MVVYQVYSHDMINGYELIGVLPERRKNPTRITRESVINWGKTLIDCNCETKKIVFKAVRIDNRTARLAWLNLPLHKHQEMA